MHGNPRRGPSDSVVAPGGSKPRLFFGDASRRGFDDGPVSVLGLGLHQAARHGAGQPGNLAAIGELNHARVGVLASLTVLGTITKGDTLAVLG